MQKLLFYKQPATYFEEALPIGNGHIGGMIYSGVDTEKISLNHDCFWSGYPKNKNVPSGKDTIKYVRKLIDNEMYDKVAKEIYDNLLNISSEAYMPVGNLLLNWGNDFEKVADYQRSLDIENAVASSSYSIDGVKYLSETFCSEPAQMMVIKRQASAKKLNCTVSFASVHPTHYMLKDNELFAYGYAPSYSAPQHVKTAPEPIIYDDEKVNRSTSFGVCLVVDTDGQLCHEENSMKISDASYVVIYLKIATNFVDFKTMPYESMLKVKERELVFKEKYDYEQLKNEHIADYKSLFDRCSLNIESTDFDNIPTDERIKRQTQTHDDNGLIVLLWDYGRYITIACSRKGTKPANLQGIWNEQERAPWSSNYTLNINAEMNYWSVLPTNLSECHEPFLEYISDLSVKGTETAKVDYGIRGWCAHHNSDIWGHSTPVSKELNRYGCVRHAFWPMASGWLVNHIWEQYEFTMDESVLKKYYDVIKGASLFALDWLQPTADGKLVAYPSSSPENAFVIDGNTVTVAKNSAMDIGIITNLFKIQKNVEKILGKDDLTMKVTDALNRMPKYQIGSKGQLLEWDKEYEELDPDHRHISLLYDLYPACGIKEKDTALRKACEKTLILRGEESTGWGLAWRINTWARLKNSQKAGNTAKQMLRFTEPSTDHARKGGIYPNMFDAHPPFQLDGNFGYTAGICEMLLQSQEGEVEVLPALPDDWSDGEFTGLKARGNHTVACKWADGKLKEIKIKCGFTGEVPVRYKDKTVMIKSVKNQEVILDGSLNVIG